MSSKVPGALLLAAALAWTIAGCSQDSVSPQNAGSPAIGALDGTSAAVESQLSFIRAGGHLPDSSKAVFTLGWRELFNPRARSSILAGEAAAIAFGGTSAGAFPFTPRGIDMGTVSLSYASNHLDLLKHTGRNGGVSYSTFSGPPGSGTNTDVAFVASTPYQFTVSGSGNFSALQISLTTPAALLSVTSPADSSVISASGDLTVTWTGGDPNTGVLVVVHTPPPHPEDRRGGNDGDHHEGDGHTGPGGPGEGQGPPPPPPGGEMGGMPPPTFDSLHAIVIRLDNNPGWATVSSSSLQSLIQRTGASRLMVTVSQLVSRSVDHDGGKVRIVLRNGDGVRVLAQ